jgi:hypothetical protein
MISRTSIVAVALAASAVLLGCSSDDGKPSDGTTGGQPSASTTEPGSKAASEVCVADADCASSVCYLGDQGSYCSVKCTPETAASVCVAPFAGTCNKKGFCKKS